jgi:hypothetical protein
MESYGIEFSKDMIHRRIELYLEEKDEENNKKVIEMLGDDKFKDKYDIQYLIMLFKFKEFKQGIEVLSKIINKKQELLNIYMQEKNYEKIIEMCYNLNESGISSAGIILNYFLDKNLRKSMEEIEIKKINEYLKKFLGKILDDNLLLPISVLSIINEKNNDIPVDIINDFIEKSIEKQLNNDISNNIDTIRNNYNSDIFGFLDIIYKYDYNTYKKIKDNWYKDEFKNININVKTNINISSKGNILEGNNEKD